MDPRSPESEISSVDASFFCFSSLNSRCGFCSCKVEACNTLYIVCYATQHRLEIEIYISRSNQVFTVPEQFV